MNEDEANAYARELLKNRHFNTGAWGRTAQNYEHKDPSKASFMFTNNSFIQPP